MASQFGMDIFGLISVYKYSPMFTPKMQPWRWRGALASEAEG